MVWNKEEILELIEKWAENEKPPYRASEFTESKGYHPSNQTIKKYTGGWFKALKTLNLSTGKYSRKEIISRMKKLDKETDGPVTQKTIRASDTMNMGRFYTVFDSLPEFREKYGLEVSETIQRRKKDAKTLFEENREKCLKRDNYTCQDCGKTENKTNRELSVHHVISKTAFKSEKHAHTLKNLISLCDVCHAERHNSINGFRASEA